MVPRIDVNDVSCDAAGKIRKQEGAHPADFFVGDIAPQRRDLFVELEHIADAGSRSGQRLERPGAQGVDLDALWPKVIGEVAGGGIEGRLADPHDVIAGNAFFTAEIGHTADASTFVEEWLSGMSDGDQAIDADVHRELEASAAGGDRISLEILSIREGDRVKKEVDLAQLLFRLLHERGDLIVFLHIQRHEERDFVVVAVEAFFDAASIPLPLVVGAVRKMGKAANTPFVHDRLGDGPSDGTIIGDAQNQPFFSREHAHAGFPSFEWFRVVVGTCVGCGEHSAVWGPPIGWIIVRKIARSDK